jgi:predicted metal-dependent hydrolase
VYPKPYLDYLVQFHAERDYFECHEILEEHWKSAPPAERKQVWVALIQIAVSLYHHRRGNLQGALKMMTNAIRLVENHQTDLQELGLDGAKLAQLLGQRLADIKAGIPYSSLNLPVADPVLQSEYRRACTEQNLPLQRNSDLGNSFLLHKHTLRDRSEVHEERLRQLELREQNRRNQAES